MKGHLQKRSRFETDDVSLEGTDPGLWFKCLLIDSLFIDCDERNVYWAKNSSSSDLLFHSTRECELKADEMLVFYRSKERLFKWGTQDFDVFMTELFAIAESVITYTDITAAEQVHNKTNLLRLLHVFILPKVKLHETEIGDIQKLLIALEEEKKKLQRKTDRAYEIKRLIENSLAKQRARLVACQYLTDFQHVSNHSLDFLEVMLDHLHKDIDKITDKMIDFDRDIIPLQNCKGEPEVVLQRTILREQRNRDLIYLNDAVIAKDSIRNVLQRSNTNGKGSLSQLRKDHPLDAVYMETSKHNEKAVKDINALEQAKSNHLAVQTAAKFALSEIQEKGKSFGYSVVSNATNKRNGMMTLSDKITELSQSDVFGSQNKLVLFSAKMKSKFLLLTNKIRTNRNNMRIEMHSRSESELSVIAKDLERVENLKRDLESMCGEIIEHLTETSKTLAAILYQISEHKLSNSQLQNVYICYEAVLSDEIMPDLQQLYEYCYHGYRKSFLNLPPVVEKLQARQTNNEFVNDGELNTKGNAGTSATEPRPMPSSDAARKIRSQIRKGIEVTALFKKLRHFLKAIQLTISNPSKHASNAEIHTNADEVIDVLTALLQKLDTKTFQRLYANIKLIEHLRPSFLDGSAHHYCVVSIHAALQHLTQTA